MKNRSIIIILAVLGLAACASFIPQAADAFCLHIDGATSDVLYQLFTCHLVHWTPEHYFYDAVCFAIMAWYIPPRRLLTLLAVACPSVAFAVMIGQPELVTYGGLSGINYSLFVAFVLYAFHGKTALQRIALLAVAAKIIFEIATGRTYFATSGFVPVHIAHLAGLIAGFLPQGTQRGLPSGQGVRPKGGPGHNRG